ncbi:hypothetical protein WJX84_001919 [Apatococcus fuscideae]|uniref:Uncharacterized protein n=1 Tax=Apatococcus fuscideae TaxID=2026836 RepID=A0AAW1SUI9_9CHLO
MSASSPTQVAVIGAGLAGAACSSQLALLGSSVTLFDMGGRGPGGRTSTRKQAGYQFDHGCQYIQPAEQGHLRGLFKQWQSEGALDEWRGTFGVLDRACGHWQADQGRTLLVGKPSMDSLVKHLAAQQGIQQRWAFKVQHLERLDDGRWLVHGTQRHPGDDPDEPKTEGPFNAVLLADILTCQSGVGAVEMGDEAAKQLLHPVGEAIKKSPCFSLMAALHVGSDAAGVSAASVSGCDALQWIACDSAKPGRERTDGMHCWVAVTSEAFARKAMSASGGQPDMDALSKQLLQKLREALRVINPDLTDDQLEAPFAAVQRWGSGFKAECHPEAYIWDPEGRIQPASSVQQPPRHQRPPEKSCVGHGNHETCRWL